MSITHAPLLDHDPPLNKLKDTTNYYLWIMLMITHARSLDHGPTFKHYLKIPKRVTPFSVHIYDSFVKDKAVVLVLAGQL